MLITLRRICLTLLRTACLSTTLAIGACTGDGDVRIAVTYSADLHEDPIRLGLSIAADDYSKEHLAPGERVDTVLASNGASPTLTVTVWMEDDKVVWNGPDFPNGSGYDIDIQIDDQGEVDERHCQRPCDLWPNDGFFRRAWRSIR